jgi:hypothetical protein
LDESKSKAKKPARKAPAKSSKSTKKTAVANTELPVATSSAPVAANVMPTADEVKATASTDQAPRNWLPIAATVVAIAIVFLGIFALLIYKYKSDSRIVQLVSGVVPYPAEDVNGHFISYHSYLFEVNSIKHYYLSQTTADGKPAVDFSTNDGKSKLKDLEKQVLTQLQSDEIVRQLAHKYKVSVSNKEVQAQVDQITKSAGGTQKVNEVLKKFYGWSQNDLRKKIEFQLLKQKVASAVSNDGSVNAQAKAKAQDVLNKVKAGGDFAALAKQYSQDSSAANGGDLGFFGKGQMVKPFEDTAFSQQPGQISGLVKSQYGYHIIKTVEFNADKSQVHAAHILIKTVDFDTYLSDQLKQAKVSHYIHP